MSPIPILRSIQKLKPCRMLDVGTRDGWLASGFADLGYEVDAIDVNEPVEGAKLDGITFRQIALEDFEPDEKYDLVIASMLSHMVPYSAPDYLAKLKSLKTDKGLIYVTLFGEDDDWAKMPRTNALSLDDACNTIEACGLNPLFKSSEWFEGKQYNGETKFWHIHKFVLV